jgi:pimeloyl-ACP methyl ester carboxylesterase
VLSDYDQQILLSDGRQIGICEIGDPRGKLVVFIGGYPGTRWMAHLFNGSALAGVRLVGIDRPGMGLSTFQPGWTITGFSQDVAAVVDALQVERFSVLGWSGGTPHAAACAIQLTERVNACGLIAPMTTPEMSMEGAMQRNRMWVSLAQKAPWSLGLMVWLLYGRMGHDPEKFKRMLDNMLEEISPADQEAYATQRVFDTMAQGMAEAFRQGMRGQAYEARLLYQPWGFTYGDIHLERVYLWQGEQDQNIPVKVGKAIAGEIDGCQATFLKDEGHISIISNHGEAILSTLVD